MEQMNGDEADYLVGYPGKSSYSMPAEWDTHAATLLQWPSNKQTWPGERLAGIEEVYFELIGILHRYEAIVLLAGPDVIASVERRLKDREFERSQINLIEYPVDDVWARDCGPIFVRRAGSAYSDYIITDWDFNAWGGKYSPFDADNKIPSFLARTFHIPLLETGMVLEGGSIETNGSGLFMTTESVLLNANRNPELTKTEIEKRLKYYLGAKKMIWLKEGLAGDDTDGHIDDIARFVGEHTIVASLPENRDDVNYQALYENLEILQQAEDQNGNRLNIDLLPLPETFTEEVTADGSKHLPASYVNFYIANGVVLVPLYDDRYDARVIETIRNHFPGRTVYGIRCSDLVWGQGSIHCITQPLYGIFP